MTNTTNLEASLLAAAAELPYLRPTCDGKVSYLPAAEAQRFTAQAHMWLPEYVIEDADENIVGRRKSAKGALALLVKLADANYRASRAA